MRARRDRSRDRGSPGEFGARAPILSTKEPTGDASVISGAGSFIRPELKDGSEEAPGHRRAGDPVGQWFGEGVS